MGDLSLTLGGERVDLLAEGALWRRELGMLLVADLHWGKAAVFRAAGVPVPFGTTSDTIDRLERMIERTKPTELIILGDLWHGRSGRHARTIEQVARWRERHAALPMTLIRGNHDLHAGDPDVVLGIRVRDEPMLSGGWALRHHPPARDAVGDGQFWVAGHVHPAVEVRGAVRDRLLVPCFHLTPTGLVLPAYGAFTGKGVIRPLQGDRVFVIVEGEVVEVFARGGGPA